MVKSEGIRNAGHGTMVNSLLALLLLSHLTGSVSGVPTMTLAKFEWTNKCSDDYLVVGLDYFTLDIIVAGNNSDFTYRKFHRPLFYRLIPDGLFALCSPLVPDCDNIAPTSWCQCSVVEGEQHVYHHILNRTVEPQFNQTVLMLQWDSPFNITTMSQKPAVRSENYQLPLVKETCEVVSTSTPTTSTTTATTGEVVTPEASSSINKSLLHSPTVDSRLKVANILSLDLLALGNQEKPTEPTDAAIDLNVILISVAILGLAAVAVSGLIAAMKKKQDTDSVAPVIEMPPPQPEPQPEPEEASATTTTITTTATDEMRGETTRTSTSI